jgi:hypothetical protein
MVDDTIIIFLTCFFGFFTVLYGKTIGALIDDFYTLEKRIDKLGEEIMKIKINLLELSYSTKPS